MTELNTQNQKQSKKGLIIGITAGFILLAIAICVVLLLTTKKIDPFNYVTPAFEGVDGTGTSAIDFNEYDLICSVIGEMPTDYDTAAGIRRHSSWQEKYDELDHDISFECSPETELKNNDKVTVTIKTKGKAAKKINSGIKTYVVSGLKETENIDFFEQVEFSVDGVSGEGRAILERNRDIDYIDNCSFSIEPMYNLENGDVVTVNILNAEELAEEYNVTPAEYSREYVVSGLGKYASCAEDIPIKLIDEIAERHLKETIATNEEEYSFFTYSNYSIYGAYLFVAKEDATYASENELQIFVTYDQYFNGEFDETIYIPITFNDVVVNFDNSLNVDYEDGSTAICTSDIEYYLEKMSWDYEIIKIS